MGALTRGAARFGLEPELVPIAAVVILGAIMSILDTTIVNVALESLSREFHAPLSTIQWIVTAYLLALATVIPLTGWASERFGTKRLYMAAIALFVLGSILCGAAWSAESLIGFRVLQGLGGGMILPVGQTILARAAGPDRMGRVMSIIGVPLLLGPVLGPVLGGLIVQDVSWRWIFYVNVPIGILALAFVKRVLPSDRPSRGVRLDLGGLLLLSPGLAALVYGLSEAGATGSIGGLRTVGALVVGVVLLVGFVILASRRRGWALIDVGLFRARGFAAAAGTTFLFGIAIFGALILLPLYYQVVRGEGALSTGLLLAPQGVGAALALPLAGRLTDRIGPGRVVPVGLVVALLGTAAFTQLSGDTSYALLAASLFVRGVGLGATVMPAMAAAYQVLSREAIPRATSALNILQRVGGSVGTALLAVVLERRVHAELPGIGGSGLGAATGVPDSLRPRVAEPLAHAFSQSFWVALALTAVALVPALILPRRRPQAPAGPPSAPARDEEREEVYVRS